MKLGFELDDRLLIDLAPCSIKIYLFYFSNHIWMFPGTFL